MHTRATEKGALDQHPNHSATFEGFHILQVAPIVFFCLSPFFFFSSFLLVFLTLGCLERLWGKGGRERGTVRQSDPYGKQRG